MCSLSRASRGPLAGLSEASSLIMEADLERGGNLNTSKKDILVIEDNLDIRILITLILEGEGFRVTSASDGLDGLNQIKISPPDIVLLDLMMPGISGIEVVRKIRSSPDPAIESIPILLLTAKSAELARPDDSGVNLAMAAGANSFLIKPFISGQLVNAITSIL